MKVIRLSDHSRKQIDLKARQHLRVKLRVIQIPKQINRSLSSLFLLWNTIVESYYTRKTQIYTKYSQHSLSIPPAMAAASGKETKSRDYYDGKRKFSQASHQWFYISLLRSSFPCYLYFIYFPFDFFPVTRYSLTRFGNTPEKISIKSVT